jgi:hypothetical protein
MMYGIKTGQVYIAADGSRCGHVVVDTTTYAECGDIVTIPFKGNVFSKERQRIDAYKLAMVRYYLVDGLPDWAK